MRNEVDVLIDVRSRPYSRFNSSTNRKQLTAVLPEADIEYVFAGKKLGGLVPKGSTDEQIKTYLHEMKTEIDKLISDNDGKKICFMCSEMNHVDCHRHWWISRYISQTIPEITALKIGSEEATTVTPESFDNVPDEYMGINDILAA